MKRINIIGVSNGVGISRDIGIIKDLLVKIGHDVSVHHTYKNAPQSRYDINIHLERFSPTWLVAATKNVLIPNQEWFEPAWVPALSYFDYVIVKSRFAQDVFTNLGCKTIFTSFTSEDRYQPQVPKDETNWLHLVGKSIQKQTEVVINTWKNNSGFPNLTVVIDPKFWKPRVMPKNVNVCYTRYSEEVLLSIQNAASVHICPSETEGFGHYINEALSCKAICLTTNAAPMNELVKPEFGFLVDVTRQEQMRLSLKNFISEKDLEKKVIDMIITDDNQKRNMRELARKDYLERDAFFKTSFSEAIDFISKGN